MAMKLFPAMLFVIALFLGGLAFLQARSTQSGVGGLRGMVGLLSKKFRRSLTVVLLLLVLFFFLRLVGKLAILITGIVFLLFLLVSKKD